MHCLACASRLDLLECVDPFAACLSCINGHRYFALPESPLATDVERASSIELPGLQGLSPEGIASFWLSDSSARASLNEQLAILLRVFLEGRHLPSEPPLSFCPSCGDALEAFEQPNIWVQAVRCASRHEWASRGSRICGFFHQSWVVLQSEPSDTVVAELVRGWLKGRPELDPQLHKSLRSVLNLLGRRAHVA